MTTVTVSQLNRYVRSLIESDAQLSHVMISGEISNFINHYKSGHLYFSLKDETALVKAVMFRSQATTLKFMPENGMKVIVRARVSLYEKDGAYQIYVDEMQPDGAGALQIAFEQLKARLEEEGLFAAERKRPIPKYPRCIGVITSSTGAAVQDIFNVLRRRYPLATVVLLPVLVQGEGAATQLVQALQTFEIMRQKQHPQTPDVIIIGRGGGSLEELWAFNDERLARTVAASVIPVISAVGHETDFTICDFAADLRAPTPSAAAELAVPDTTELLQRLALLQIASKRAVCNALQQKKQRLETLIEKPCLRSPLYFSEERAMHLDYLLKRFSSALALSISRSDRRLAETAGKLHALSPLQVLSRGYAIAQHGQAVIQSVDDVAVGDEITLRVHDGEINCYATAKNKGEKK